VADQGELPPLREGVWIGVGEGCPEHNARRQRFPSDCTPLDIRRDEDGAWRVRLRVDLVNDLSSRERLETEDHESNGPYRVLFVPAVERDLGLAFAPLYVGEVARLGATDSSVTYAVVAPMGEMPASEMRIAATILCEVILRDGPIEGVTPRYITRTDEQGTEVKELDECAVSSQAAVREAARRIVIENLGELMQRRYVWVRAD